MSRLRRTSGGRAARTLAALTMAALALTGCSQLTGTKTDRIEVKLPAVTDRTTGKQLQLTWDDEFSGDAGSRPDHDEWSYNTGGSGWGNRQRQYNTDDPANASLDGDGHLDITARTAGAADQHCWYGPCIATSARLLTRGKFEQKYGRFEARIRIPEGRGLWPAFWMLGGNSCGDGEIDIQSTIGSRTASNYGGLEGPGHCEPGRLQGTKPYTLPAGPDFAGGYHTFAVDWSPSAVAWLVDGRVVQRLAAAELSHPWVYDHPFFLVLDLAVGGRWPGSPNARTKFPATMTVDYVRVYAATK